MRIYRLLRYRYPYTTGGVAYLVAAIALLFFGPVRKLGEVLLAAAVIGVASFLASQWQRRARR